MGERRKGRKRKGIKIKDHSAICMPDGKNYFGGIAMDGPYPKCQIDQTILALKLKFFGKKMIEGAPSLLPSSFIQVFFHGKVLQSNG